MPYYVTPEGPPTDRELDLTNSHLHSLDDVELKDGITWLDLTANRLKSIDPRILQLKELKFLSFRQNLLQDAAAINNCQCKAALQELIFHDNLLKEVPQLCGFNALTRLEFSYNEVRSIEPLSSLSAHATALRELYVANNKVTAIEGLHALASLQVLELGSNRIRAMDGLSALTNLAELWLGRNRIHEIHFAVPLTNLRKLALPSNRLESMRGIEDLAGLEELYLSFNGIKKMEGLQKLNLLKTLDLANNQISVVEDLTAQCQLADLWMNDNNIESFGDIEQVLCACRSSLVSVYFENNPVADRQDYSAKLLTFLPNLEQLDSKMVGG